MTAWRLLFTLCIATLLASGCGPGHLSFDDGNPDDDTGDDDVADDDASDDDTGDDDASDDDTGDDDAGDDDVADDDTGDDDATPQVDCGPFEPPPAGEASRVFSGEGSLDVFAGWWWAGCEVERRFAADGSLECELVWEVEGDYYAWDQNSMTARYELEFDADEGASTCTVEPDEQHQTWYYTATFHWGAGEMELGFSSDPWGNSTPWATADIEDQGDHAPFSYVTDALDY